MARTRYIPHDQDREDIRAEDRADRRAMRNCEVAPDPNDPRFGLLNPMDPEFDSVDEFADFLFDDERTSFTHHEMACLNYRGGLPVRIIRRALEDYGLTLKGQTVEKHVRGYNAWDNNRWSSPC